MKPLSWIVAATAIAIAGACSGGESELPLSPPGPTSASTATVTAPLARAEVETILRELEVRVGELRGLTAPRPVERHFVTAAEVAAVIAADLQREDTGAELQQLESIYRLLGLIDTGDDLRSIYEQLLGEQVLALYDAETDTIFVIADAEFDAIEEASYAHEYVHYLQDATHDLERLIEPGRLQPDRRVALTALVEGDATLTQSQYVLTAFSRADLSALAAALPDAESETATVPFAVQQALEFPYVAGFEFATALYRVGGTAELDAAFVAPPSTTEQIMHPEKYLAREGALDVAPPALDVVLDGWRQLEPFALGEFLLLTWLQANGASITDAERAAAGWGGDATVIATAADGTAVLASLIRWDAPTRDGEQFHSTATAALDATSRWSRVSADNEAEMPIWEGAGGYLALARTVDGVSALAAGPTQELTLALLVALTAPR